MCCITAGNATEYTNPQPQFETHNFGGASFSMTHLSTIDVSNGRDEDGFLIFCHFEDSPNSVGVYIFFFFENYQMEEEGNSN